MENPIFGYNLIEDLVVSKKSHNFETFETLKPVFSHVILEGAVTVLAILQKVKDSPDF